MRLNKKLILLNQTNGAKSKIAPNVGNKSRILLRGEIMDGNEIYNVELFDLANKVSATSIYITSSDGKPIKLVYENCEYCKKLDADVIPPEIPKEDLDADSLHAYVYFNGELDVWDFQVVKQDTFLINYCPMCGRRLR